METKPGDEEGLATTIGKASKTEEASVPGPAVSTSAPVDDVSDPEEDDLDDLDGLLQYLFSPCFCAQF